MIMSTEPFILYLPIPTRPHLEGGVLTSGLILPGGRPTTPDQVRPGDGGVTGRPSPLPQTPHGHWSLVWSVLCPAYLNNHTCLLATQVERKLITKCSSRSLHVVQRSTYLVPCFPPLLLIIFDTRFLFQVP